MEKVFLRRDHGIDGDAHAGPGPRQVSLLAVESVNRQRERLPASAPVLGPGIFAENITVEGMELMTLPLGTILRVGGDAVLEVTRIGKECHDGCEIKKLSGDCVMPREGIFARVTGEGWVKTGDPVEVEYPPAEGKRGD